MNKAFVLLVLSTKLQKITLRLVNGPTTESVNYSLKNSCLVSDYHSSYINIKQRLPNMIFDHHKVNHSIIEFKNFQGFTTKLIESIWSELKTFCSTLGKFEHLAMIIGLFMFKKNNSLSLEIFFDQILELLKISN